MNKSALARIIIWVFVALILAGILIAFLFGNAFNIENWNFGMTSLLTYEDANNYSVGATEINPENIFAIEANWINGTVTVEPVDSELISISENSSLDENDKLRYLVKDGKLTIQFAKAHNFFGFANNNTKKDLVIKIPTSCAESLNELTIGSVSAEVKCNDIKTQKFNIETVSGGVTLSDITTDMFKCETVSGNIIVTDISADTLDGETVSGEISFNGNIKHADMESISGDINIISDTHLLSADIESTSGDFELTIPSDSEFSVDLDGVHNFNSDFSFKQQGEKKVCGNGTADFNFETISGNFSIHSQSAD